jgi:hypothetical protein
VDTLTVMLREEVWGNLGGMSRPCRVAPSRLPKWSRGLPWKVVADIEIVMPPEKELSGSHPELVDRLVEQWGEGMLSSLLCSTGNFYKALREGDKITLAHIWAEIFVLWLRTAMLQLGLHDFECAERFRTTSQDSERTQVRVTFYFSDPLPKQFSNLATLISGYLNRLQEGAEFNLAERMAAYVAFRRARPINKEAA